MAVNNIEAEGKNIVSGTVAHGCAEESHGSDEGRQTVNTSLTLKNMCLSD